MSIQEEVELSIYDMYVMNNSGIPVFAGCTTSDYCAQHAEQHPLHTGFIAALQSFGKEVFSGALQNLSFPDVKLNFKAIGDYTLVFVNPKSADDVLINQKLEEAAGIFEKKYEGKIKSYHVTEKQFQDFTQDMVDIGLLPRDRLQSTKDYFVTEIGEAQDQSSSLIDRFRQKFNRLIKKN